MKIIAKIISLYFLVLIALPAIKIVAMQFEGDCCEAKQKQCQTDKPKGCQKEKCILNYCCITSQFIVQQIHTISFNPKNIYIAKNKLTYEKVFIGNYQNNIWHPPKQQLSS